MENDLTALLLGTVAITDLVGNRIHWMRQPGSIANYPYVNLRVVSAPVNTDLDRAAVPQQVRVQVDVWCESYTQLITVKQAVQVWARDRPGSGAVTSLRLLSGRDLAGSAVGDEKALFGHAFDLMVHGAW